MKKCSDKLATQNGKCEAGVAGDAFREFVREQVREIIIGVMTAEVESLCGPRHQAKSGSEFYRSGSAPGYVPACWTPP